MSNMEKPENLQDEEFQGLLKSPLKVVSRPSPQKHKCSKTFIATLIFLLGLSLFVILQALQLNAGDMLGKSEPDLSSFIQRSRTKTVAVVNDVIKPKIDPNTYRYLDLPNGMKVMLISDPETLSGSASVSVKVGSFEDPKEMQGLAHFCEHMVFLKSEQYPELDGFQKFVSAYGGSTNAFTQSEETTYYFETTSGGLEEGVKRFSSFFVDPIFTSELMEDEVVSIDGELHRNLNDGGWRLRFLLQIVSNPESPLSDFNTGSVDSLITIPKRNGVDILQKLKDFFDKYYSANLMSGVIVHNKPIDEIQALAEETFAKIPNKNREKPSYSQSAWPFSGRYGKKLVQYIPSDPLNTLQLIFSVDTSLKHPFLEPYHYLTQILTDKGEGSLVNYLTEKELGNSVVVGSAMVTSEFELFLIDINLTEKGFQSIEEVAKAVFAYLNLVLTDDISEEFYNQFARINNATFNYVESGDGTMDRVSKIASNLWTFAPKYGLSGSQVGNKFDKELLTQYIKQLNPDNLMIFVRNSDFDTSSNPTDTFNKNLLELTAHKAKTHRTGALKHTNKIKDGEAEGATKIHFKELDLYDSLYGIPYAISDLPANFLNELKQVKCQDYPEMKLPEINEFVSDTFKLVEKACLLGEMSCRQNYTADSDQRNPTEILDNDKIRSWHQLFRTTQTPMIVSDIVFYSEAIQKDLTYATFAALKTHLISDILEEELFQLAATGNSVNIKPTALQITAFSDVFPDVMSLILEKYKNFDFTEEQFIKAMGGLYSQLYYAISDSPYMNLVKYKSKLLLDYYWMETEIFAMSQMIDYDTAKEYLKDLYTPLHCEALFVGNLLEDQAKEYSQKIVDVLDYEAPESDAALQNRVLNITGGNYIFRTFEPTGSETQNMILNVYQDGIVNTKKLTYLQLLMKVLEMEVYSYIRTEQQIGYFVQAFPDRTKNVLSLNIMIESNTLNPNQMDEHIEIALKRTAEKLNALTDDDFENLAKSLKETLSEESQTLSEKADSYLSHILNQDYIFDMKYRVIDYLGQATKQGLLAYYDKLVKTPRKLSIQFYSNSGQPLPLEILPKEKQFSGTEPSLLTDATVLESLTKYPIAFDLDTE